MNAILSIIENEVVNIKSIIMEETYHFYTNEPANEQRISDFEAEFGMLPKEYKEFLLKSDGAIIFKSENEDDVLFIDLSKENNNIIDGDSGYPVEEWNYISGNINTFFAHLIQANGAMFWRW